MFCKKSYKYASAHLSGPASWCKCLKTLPSTLLNIDLQNCAALNYWVGLHYLVTFTGDHSSNLDREDNFDPNNTIYDIHFSSGISGRKI